MKLSIVVPCYNEEKNIPIILEKFDHWIKEEEIEVLMVDNGSTDRSNELLHRLIDNYNFVKIVEVKQNRGYGFGVLQGLYAASGDFIGWTHADLQTDPSDVIKAYHILEHYQWDKDLMIKGNRKGRPLFDVIFTAGMSLFETLYLKCSLNDINAQPNIFSKEFMRTWRQPPNDFSLDLYVLYLARKRKLRVIRFPVLFPPRVHGSSHWNTGFLAKWKFIKRTVNFSRKLKKEGII